MDSIVGSSSAYAAFLRPSSAWRRSAAPRSAPQARQAPAVRVGQAPDIQRGFRRATCPRLAGPAHRRPQMRDDRAAGARAHVTGNARDRAFGRSSFVPKTYGDILLSRCGRCAACDRIIRATHAHAPPARARPPELVAEITFLGWTNEPLLRHTVFVGLRDDKPAREVRREAAVKAPRQ
jgi:hypothetical protein